MCGIFLLEELASSTETGCIYIYKCIIINILYMSLGATLVVMDAEQLLFFYTFAWRYRC